MSNDTVITVVGNLTTDPNLRYTSSGAAVVDFTIASTPRSFDRNANEWKDGETLFLRCSAWREHAEHVAESLTKGTRVIVQGRLKSRSYDDREGNRRTVFEVDVEEVGPSLRYATAKVNRTSGQGGGGWQGGGGQGGSHERGGGQAGGDNWQSGGSQSSNRGPANDPWASAQSEEPPF